MTDDGVLDRVERFVRDFVVLPDEAAYVAVTLWCAHTHLTPSLRTTPRLAIYSPEYGCGKSRLLEVCQLLCHSPEMMANVSPAYLFRRVDQDSHPPTLLLDEADTLWGRGGSDQHQELRGLVNAGYRRGSTVGRVTGPQHDKVEQFRVFAPVALAGRGRDSIPESVATRSVHVAMRKRAHGETLRPWRPRDVEPRGHSLRASLAVWAGAVADEAHDHDPLLPEVIQDRDLEVWEPLVTVADLAGGDWPNRSRVAAVAAVTAGRTDADDMPLARRLLADIRQAFGDDDRLTTADLLERLRGMPDAPWDGLSGNGLDARRLSRMLRDYGVKPADIRFDYGVRKGYDRDLLRDAWNRYLPPDGPVSAVSATSATPATLARGQTAADRDAGPVADVADVAGFQGTARITRCQHPGCVSAADGSGRCHSHRESPLF